MPQTGRKGETVKHLYIRKSENSKIGPMPTTYGARDTCPPSCGLYRAGCYGEDFYTRLAWGKVDRLGVDTETLAGFIAGLPDGAVWRLNVVGDLPGEGESVDAAELGEIVRANIGRRGFTYTHKRTPDALQWIRHANNWGFTVNLSADDAGEADELADTGAGPVVALVPMDTPEKTRTPAGRPIVVCPAQTREGVTCLDCQLCQRRDRAVIVGFRAHGTRAAAVDFSARRVIPIHEVRQ